MKKQTLKTTLFLSVLIILLFSFLPVVGQEVENEYVTGTITLPDSLKGMLAIAPWEPPTTVTIGKYVIPLDSLKTMKKDELDDFANLITILVQIRMDEVTVDILCRRYLPERLLCVEGKKSE